MDDLLSQCRYPPLPERYLTGLKAAVEYILREYDVLGIIAAGSVVRGEGHPSSDLDIYVIHRQPTRQMIQTFFAGIPTQIFLNPPQRIERYFAEESAEGVCITAHMLVTGFLVLERDPFVDEIRGRAKEVLNQSPAISATALNMRRYHTASQYENAMDLADSDSAAAVMLLSQAVFQMCQFYFLREGRYIPRDKDLLRRLSEHSPELGKLANEFYRANDPVKQFELAAKIADLTTQAHGFFECETELETVTSDE